MQVSIDFTQPNTQLSLLIFSKVLNFFLAHYLSKLNEFVLARDAFFSLAAAQQRQPAKPQSLLLFA